MRHPLCYEVNYCLPIRNMQEQQVAPLIVLRPRFELQPCFVGEHDGVGLLGFNRAPEGSVDFGTRSSVTNSSTLSSGKRSIGSRPMLAVTLFSMISRNLFLVIFSIIIQFYLVGDRRIAPPALSDVVLLNSMRPYFLDVLP